MVLLVRFTLSAFPEWPLQNDGCFFWVAATALQDLRLAGLPALRVSVLSIASNSGSGRDCFDLCYLPGLFRSEKSRSVVLVLSDTGLAFCDLRAGNDFILDSFSTAKRQPRARYLSCLVRHRAGVQGDSSGLPGVSRISGLVLSPAADRKRDPDREPAGLRGLSSSSRTFGLLCVLVSGRSIQEGDGRSGTL